MAARQPLHDDDDLALKKQQLRVLELERKANFESTQNDVRRQRDQLKQLRRENKELRAARQASRKGSSVGSAPYLEKEKELMKNKVYATRRAIDDLKAENDRRTSEIENRNEQLSTLMNEGQPLLQDSSPLTQKIRALENRLDKSLIKYNEAMTIRRTYEQILHRLRDERVGFDNQLAAIEKTLKAKEHDYLELLNMAHDAHHAKEIARAEVQQFKQAYSDERKQKRKELEERKAYVTSRMDQALKQEKAMKQKKMNEERDVSKQEEEERRRRDLHQNTADLRTEEEQERLNQYAEAYRRIKEVTKANSVDEVIAKFVAQEDTHKTLVDMTRDVQANIEKLNGQRTELRRKLDESSYSGSGQLGSRRIVDEFEAHLAEAKAQQEKASREYEHTAKLYTAVKAGIEHLVEKLSTYRPEMQPPSAGDDNVVDQLKHCEQKLQMLVDEAVANNENVEDLPFDMPVNNQRVKVVDVAEEEEEDAVARKEGVKGEDDGGEDDPHDRQVLKQMSISAVERENKKARKRGRKKDEQDG